MTERALAARGGVLSDGFALLLRPIQEGVIGIKPRGEKQRTILFAFLGGPFFRTQIHTGQIIQRTKI